MEESSGVTPPSIRVNDEPYDLVLMTAFVRMHASSVPARELDVFYKLYFERRSKKEAAGALGISVNTIGTLLRRLRKRLKGAADS